MRDLSWWHPFLHAASDKTSWLDLCAGPGGKAALLASIAKEEGHLFTANEISSARAELVKRVVAGAPVWVGDAREISQKNETFDAVLADVPCTGLGALRRRPEVRWRRNVSDLRSLIQLQSEILMLLFLSLTLGESSVMQHVLPIWPKQVLLWQIFSSATHRWNR